MYTIIICAIIGLGIGLLIRDCQVILAILGACLGVLIALFAGMAVTYDTKSYKESYEIIAQQDGEVREIGE